MDARILWRAGDPRLAFDADLARARRTLLGYAASDPYQADFRATLLDWLATHEHPLERRSLAGHLTASALLVDGAGKRALLTMHRKLGRWLQLGGHCDGDANLAGAAMREAQEESGISDLAIDPDPIDLDVHSIPARAHEPRHLHLDVRFLVRAQPGAQACASLESTELRWVTPAELVELPADGSLRRLFRKVFGAP